MLETLAYIIILLLFSIFIFYWMASQWRRSPDRIKTILNDGDILSVKVDGDTAFATMKNGDVKSYRLDAACSPHNEVIEKNGEFVVVRKDDDCIPI